MDVIRAALIACRFVHDTAAMTLWGTFGYLLICVPEDLAEETTKRLGRLPAIAAVATIITAVALLPIKTAMIADGWPSAFSPKILWAVVWTTSIGTAWLVDIVASILLVLAIFLRPPHRILVTTRMYTRAPMWKWQPACKSRLALPSGWRTRTAATAMPASPSCLWVCQTCRRCPAAAACGPTRASFMPFASGPTSTAPNGCVPAEPARVRFFFSTPHPMP